MQLRANQVTIPAGDFERLTHATVVVILERFRGVSPGTGRRALTSPLRQSSEATRRCALPDLPFPCRWRQVPAPSDSSPPTARQVLFAPALRCAGGGAPTASSMAASKSPSHIASAALTAYAEQRLVKAHRSHHRSQYAEMKSIRSPCMSGSQKAAGINLRRETNGHSSQRRMPTPCLASSPLKPREICR